MKKFTIIFAVLISLSACYVEENKNNVSECRSFASTDFQFMTKDAIHCYVYFNSSSNFIQVKNAVRNIIINHDALELKDPKICYNLEEVSKERRDDSKVVAGKITIGKRII